MTHLFTFFIYRFIGLLSFILYRFQLEIDPYYKDLAARIFLHVFEHYDAWKNTLHVYDAYSYITTLSLFDSQYNVTMEYTES